MLKKDTGVLVFIAALFTGAKIRKQVSVSRWVDENKYTNREISFSYVNKMKYCYFETTWKDLQGIVLSEMSDKDRYCEISLTYGI